MNKILRLDKSYDLWLSYSWSNNNHGVCGHTFEVIDYYYILKDHFKVGILLAEDVCWDILEKSITSKYNFNNKEIKEIKESIVFSKRPSLVSGNNIIFTDGGIKSTNECVLLFSNILYMACGNLEVKNNKDDRVWILQDNRIYEKPIVNGINYKKKILFDRLKEIDRSDNSILLYGTKNCRDIKKEEYFEISGKYDRHILALTNEENKPDYKVPGIEFVVPPLNNIFEKFQTYIYTPVQRKWDCSPRFIAECKYYGKEVIYYKIDYWKEDKGLYWRKWDIDNDFESISLKRDDELVSILRGIIGG